MSLWRLARTCRCVIAIAILAAGCAGTLATAEEDPGPSTPLSTDEADAGVEAGEAPTAFDPDQEAWMREEIDRAVEARLAGIPRPVYIPATDIAPPKGLLLYRERPGRGDFPFALAIGGFMQLRWLEFARSATSWTNAAGDTLPINNINTFNIDRYFLTFSGHVVDERLVYTFALFGTTNIGVRAGAVPLGMAGWKFSDAATVGVGMTNVPGTREWIIASPWTVGVDRSMANTFFRPGYSPGAAATGALLDGEFHYQGGVWNAIDGGTSGVFRRGTSMAFAGNVWWEPLGAYGFGPGDMECHDEPVIRLGTSGVDANTYPLALVGANPEDTIVRLSDGTPLATVGALGTDAQVRQFLYQLASVDAGIKYGGWAANAEYYFRLLNNFNGVGTFNRSSSYDQGGQVYLSWCFIPRSHEVYARSSVVTGPFGTGQEYGGGLNWYVRQSRQARFTIEALTMNRNPAQNFIYPYRAGYTGTAIQTQFVVAY